MFRNPLGTVNDNHTPTNACSKRTFMVVFFYLIKPFLTLSQCAIIFLRKLSRSKEHIAHIDPHLEQSTEHITELLNGKYIYYNFC